VQGYTDEDGRDRGCLVTMTPGTQQALRNLFHGLNGVEALSSPVKIPDRAATGGYRTIPRMLEQNRGAYAVEPIEDSTDLTVILTVRGQEYLRFRMETQYLREKPAARAQEFKLVGDD
jgi:hypothetical protein